MFYTLMKIYVTKKAFEYIVNLQTLPIKITLN